MRIGYLQHDNRGLTDPVLTALAEALQAAGLAVAGAVQVTSGDAGTRCDMDLTILPGGTVIRISQSLGAGSKGCRLDVDALERAVAAVDLTGADVLVLNKFGKHEAEGRGFRSLIADALGQGMPVLIGVNAQNRVAFAEFAGDLAEPVSMQPAAVLDWLVTHRLKKAV